jgi:hypothetical protein
MTFAVSASDQPGGDPVVETAGPGSNYEPLAGGKFTFDKYLVMKADAVIPSAEFSFTIAPGAHIDADTAKRKLEVLAGIGEPTIGIGDATDGKVSFSAADTAVLESAAPKTDNPAFKTETTDDEKYVKKTLTIDLSGIEFTEPGVYRYVITEVAAAEGSIVANDEVPKRTLDIYVDDDTAAAAEQKTVKIAKYVLYSGEVTTAPDADVAAGKTDYDGITVKSTGYTNTYDTYDLEFSKTVAGNQGSKDKYFKFTVTIENVPGAVISVDADNSIFDQAPLDNSANAYTAEVMAAANSADANNTVDGQQFAAENGTITFDMYLQHGQTVHLCGIPAGAKYTIAEAEEDYAPSIVVTGDTTNDQENDIDELKADTYTDKSLDADTTAVFTNTRNGAIPTGVILSIAAPAAVGAGLVGTLIVLSVKKKKHEDEE